MKNRDQGTGAPAAAPTSAGELDDRAIPDFTDEFSSAGEPAPGGGPEEGVPVAAGEKPKFTGDWSCSLCGASITSLPFEPRSTSGLKCLDCFKASKA